MSEVKTNFKIPSISVIQRKLNLGFNDSVKVKNWVDKEFGRKINIEKMLKDRIRELENRIKEIEGICTHENIIKRIGPKYDYYECKDCGQGLGECDE